MATSDLVKKILRDALGGAEDNLCRAKAAFRGMTPGQMQEFYGQSGKTRQEILDGYQQYYDNISADIAALNTAASEAGQ